MGHLNLDVVNARLPRWFSKGKSEFAAIYDSGENLLWVGHKNVNGRKRPSVWKCGIWERDIIWEDGIWEYGIWKGGSWSNGVWKNGIWEDGAWESGTWEYGTHNGGIWGDGTWKNGIWKNGFWFNGIWKKGTWVKGWILDKNKKGAAFENGEIKPGWRLNNSWSAFVLSNLDPKEYFKKK